MKRMLLPLFLVLSFSMYAQNLIDFETYGHDFKYNVFSTGGDSTDFAIVDNPNPSGINTSAKVARLTVHANGDPWAGVWTQGAGPISLTAQNKIISVMVYKDVISPFNFKLEPPNVDHNVPNTVINQWEKLTFDYTTAVGTTAQTITIIPDFPSARTAGSVNYYDNINFGDVVVPVELTSFSGLAVPEGAKIIWTTASEKNNQGFEIQRSTDNHSFVNIAFVDGKGSTTERSEYSYIDKDASGKTYYRLRQVDFDGTSVYTNSIEVNSYKGLSYELAQNYPNPFNPSTTIRYAIPDNNFVSVKVFDVLGNEVSSLVNEQKEAGQYEINFNAASLSSGVYYYSITAGNFTASKKFILMK